jgi:ribosome-binding factor A
MDTTRHEKIAEALREVAAEFMAREANRNILLTVTRVMLSDDNKRATIYITAFPESGEPAAVEFANRNRPELKDFYKKRVKGGLPPDITFEIDMGEKNRRRLDELSN